VQVCGVSFTVCLFLRKTAWTPREKAYMLHVAALEQGPSLAEWRQGHWQWMPPRNCQHLSLLLVKTSSKILPLSIAIDCKFWGDERGGSCNRWWHETAKLTRDPG
jgi:hypothetical protein